MLAKRCDNLINISEVAKQSLHFSLFISDLGTHTTLSVKLSCIVLYKSVCLLPEDVIIEALRKKMFMAMAGTKTLAEINRYSFLTENVRFVPAIM